MAKRKSTIVKKVAAPRAASGQRTNKAPIKTPAFIKLALTPQVAKLGAMLAGNASPSAQTVVQVQGNMASGDLYIVKIDGIKVGMTNDHGSKPVSAGDHWLTTDLVGDVGSTVTVIATVNGAQVAACTCTVVDGSNPARHADCADDFTT